MKKKIKKTYKFLSSHYDIYIYTYIYIYIYMILTTMMRHVMYEANVVVLKYKESRAMLKFMITSVIFNVRIIIQNKVSNITEHIASIHFLPDTFFQKYAELKLPAYEKNNIILLVKELVKLFVIFMFHSVEFSSALMYCKSDFVLLSTLSMIYEPDSSARSNSSKWNNMMVYI